jgi:hypothetical protein
MFSYTFIVIVAQEDRGNNLLFIEVFIEDRGYGSPVLRYPKGT